MRVAACNELLQRYAVLRRVVEDRESLQQLWNDIAANPARAVAQLRDWCRRAEDSGIGALQRLCAGPRALRPLKRKGCG